MIKIDIKNKNKFMLKNEIKKNNNFYKRVKKNIRNQNNE
jgi:hypothetical protein